MLSKLIH